MALAGHGLGPLSLRQWASRPQLKRGSLDGADPDRQRTNLPWPSRCEPGVNGAAHPSRWTVRRLCAPMSAPFAVLALPQWVMSARTAGASWSRDHDGAPRAAPSNMRLKLSGAVVLGEWECLCAGAHELSFNDTAPCGRVARSLSAVR